MKKNLLKCAFIADVLAITLFSSLAITENGNPATGLSALSSLGRFVQYLGILGVLVIILVALIVYAVMNKRR